VQSITHECLVIVYLQHSVVEALVRQQTDGSSSSRWQMWFGSHLLPCHTGGLGQICYPLSHVTSSVGSLLPVNQQCFVKTVDLLSDHLISEGSHSISGSSWTVTQQGKQRVTLTLPMMIGYLCIAFYITIVWLNYISVIICIMQIVCTCHALMHIV